MEGTDKVRETAPTVKDKESNQVPQPSEKIVTPAKKASVTRDEPEDDHNDNYDNREARTFTIRKLHAVVTKQFTDIEGRIGSVDILNLEIASPTSVRRFISVSGQNAKNMSRWLL